MSPFPLKAMLVNWYPSAHLIPYAIIWTCKWSLIRHTVQWSWICHGSINGSFNLNAYQTVIVPWKDLSHGLKNTILALINIHFATSNWSSQILFFRCRYLSSERETMLSVHDEMSAMPEGTDIILRISKLYYHVKAAGW